MTLYGGLWLRKLWLNEYCVDACLNQSQASFGGIKLIHGFAYFS